MANTENQDINLEQAESDFKNYLKNINTAARGSMVPVPPKPGEVMICQICGKEMYPKDFSKDEKIRKREWKWHIHNSCFNTVDDLLDRSTPGLLSERRRK